MLVFDIAEVVLVLSGLASRIEILDLRGGLRGLDCRLDDLIRVLIEGFAGEFKLDLREGVELPYAAVSGDLISVPPFDTSRVCRLGDALVIDDFRGRISSLSGDVGRTGVVATVVYSLYIVCRVGLLEGTMLLVLGDGDFVS